MGVAFDANATSPASGAGLTSATLTNLTIGAGANRALVAQICWQSQSVAGVVVQWDKLGTPQGLTQIVAGNTTSLTGSEALWGLTAPTSGAKQLFVSWTGASDIYLNSTAFTGVNQTGGSTTFVAATSVTGTTSGANAVVSIVITSAVGNWTFANAVTDLSSLSTPTQTQGYVAFALGMAGISSHATGAATVTHSYTVLNSGDHWAIGGCNIVAAGVSVDVVLRDPPKKMGFRDSRGLKGPGFQVFS